MTAPNLIHRQAWWSTPAWVAVGTAAAYGAFLAWDQRAAYADWQVVALVLIMGAPAVWTGRRRHHGRQREIGRGLHRPCAGPVDRRALGRSLAPGADAPEAVNTGAVRRHRPRAHRSALANDPLSEVTHGAVQGWVSMLSTQRSAATVRKVHRVLSLMLKSAVMDGRLVRNPADHVNLPRVVERELRFLDHDQVRWLADECGAMGIVVMFLSYTGVRFGEMAALRVGRLDLMRRRAMIAESVTVVRGVQTWGTPKGHERREVPIPKFLVDRLAAHVAGKSPSDLVFAGPKGARCDLRAFSGLL